MTTSRSIWKTHYWAAVISGTAICESSDTINNPDGSIYDHGQQILDALAKDRYGIAVSNLRYLTPQVKPLALAAKGGRRLLRATKENLIQRKYPFTRVIPAFLNARRASPWILK